MKAATGASIGAAKYDRVALAIRTYRWRTGPASFADTCRTVYVLLVRPRLSWTSPAARALCTHDTSP